jgi:uncharacterized protein (DUF1684 family)
VGLTAGPHRRGEQRHVELEIVDWRRETSKLYAAVRAERDPERAHALWRSSRDRLFTGHPQSPLPPDDPIRATGVPYWPYDPDLRFALPLLAVVPATRVSSPTSDGEAVTLSLIGRLELPSPLDASIAVWWLQQYGGGLFVPVRDGTAGDTSYGGGRYLLDTAKGSDLGGRGDLLVVDLNFLYHPSCRYSARWQCPLAPEDNAIDAPVAAGERLAWP